jgi:hypothetical protein
MIEEEYIDEFVSFMSEVEDNWNGELSAPFKRILFEFGAKLLEIKEKTL